MGGAVALQGVALVVGLGGQVEGGAAPHEDVELREGRRHLVEDRPALGPVRVKGQFVRLGRLRAQQGEGQNAGVVELHAATQGMGAALSTRRLRLSGS